jgi:hypothetical protein
MRTGGYDRGAARQLKPMGRLRGRPTGLPGTPMLEEIGMFVRFARDLKGYLGAQLSESDGIRLMGSHRNGWLTNSFMASLIVISIYVSGKNLWELWLRM